MSLVDTETGEIVAMNRAEAEKITAEIKAWAGTLWAKLREAHQGRAWIALGYATWADYVQAEFDIGKSQSYRLLAHSRAVAALADAAGLVSESPIGDIPEHHTRDVDAAAVAAEVAEQVKSLLPHADDGERAEVVKRTLTEHYAEAKPAPQAARRTALSAIARDPEATNEEIAARTGVPLISVVKARAEIDAEPSAPTGGPAPEPAQAEAGDAHAAQSPEDPTGEETPSPVDPPPFDPAAYRDRGITEELKARKGLLALDPALLAQTDRLSEWVVLARDVIAWGEAVQSACSTGPNLRSVG